MVKMDVQANVFEANDEIAARLRQEWRRRRTAVINLISSPGSGKTTLLEHTLARLQSRLRVAVLVGDIQTDNDARRLAPFGFPVRQIVTAGDCHLEAHLVERHLQFIETADLDLLFIENVGNLVCPTDYDLGEDAKVVLLSTTEGEDKPLKYPAIFHRATAALLTKTDLLAYLDFSLEAVKHNLRTVHPGVPLFEVSARTGDGLEPWLDWLFMQVRIKKSSDDTARGGDRHVRGRAG
jgi:hydrogenase nickel incorporation protein HypB